MDEIKILLIDDEKEQFDLVKESIDEFNTNKEVGLVIEWARTPEEAMIKLYQDYFSAIIIDLKLKSDDVDTPDERLSGNILLNRIIEKEIIPIAVRTGFPDRVILEVKDSIKIYSKDNEIYQIIEHLMETYSSSVFKLFGSRGKISKNIKELFWDIIPQCSSLKDEVLESLPNEKQETVIIRYISSWFSNKYMFDEKYIDVDPIEMYMFPNPIEQVCTCDIYQHMAAKGENSYYLVLTPSCDLANKKVDNVILCKILDFQSIEAFSEVLDKYNKTKSNSKKSALEKWFRNAQPESLRYHFLPKVNLFPGGFVDFRSIISLEYDRDIGTIKDSSTYKKVGVITEGFKRDIISRFSAYYHRQGQPEFNSESVLKNLE